MILRELLVSTPIFHIWGDKGIRIEGIAVAPEKVEEGYMYIYSPEKTQLTYEDAVAKAVDKGVAAICIEKNYQILPYDVTFIKTYNRNRFFSALARNYYANPSQSMNLTGVTGSHGKTTVGGMVKSVLRAADIKSIIIGTNYYQIGDEQIEVFDGKFNSLWINSIIREAVDDMIGWGIIECSYTGIVEEILRHIRFNSLIYTDLYTYFKNQQDHYYFEIRKTLLDYLKLSISPIIVNIDDLYANQLKRNNTSGYGIFNRTDVNAYNIELFSDYSRFIAITRKGNIQVKLSIPGLHNVYNALAAISWGLSQGFDLDIIRDGIEGFCEKEDIDNDEGIQDRVGIYTDNHVDPERLEGILSNFKDLNKENMVIILCVSECNHDEGFESIINIIDRYANNLIITSDYPCLRTDMEAFKKDYEDMENVELLYEADHYKALQKAVYTCRKGGNIIILAPGKSHDDRISTGLTKKQ